MAVCRVDLNACIGCQKCYEICPLDVFRFHYEKKKSVIAYVYECQVCGQCVVNCPTGSLGITFEEASQPITCFR